MTRALYKNWRFGAPIQDSDLTWRALRVRLVTETSYKFEEIDKLPLTDILDIQSVWHAEALVAEANKPKKK